MRSIQTLATLVLLAFALAGCSGVETRPAETANFAAGNYHYYKWRSEPLVNTAHSSDPVYALDPVLREELDTILRNKGYILNKDKAEFSVDYIFATGMRMGEKPSESSNLNTYPGVIPTTQIDGAVVDNAHALGGVKETRNIGLQFNDVERNEEVWRVIITKIVENVNVNDNPQLRGNVRKALDQGLRTLPEAQ